MAVDGSLHLEKSDSLVDGLFEPQPRPSEAPRTMPPPPGLLERVIAGIGILVFYHQTPNVWFIQLAPNEIIDFSNQIGVAVVLSVCASAFLRVAGRLNLLIRLIKLEPTVFLFAALALTSFLWSADPNTTMRRGIIFMAVTLFAGYLIIRFPLSEIIEIFAWTFVASAAVNLFFVLALPTYGIDDEGLWTGVFRQKNGLGYVAALAVPTLLIAARIHKPQRLIFYSAAALQLLLLIRSDSKTMLVVGVLATLLLPLYNGLRASRTLKGAVLVTLIASSVFSVAIATANVAVLADWLNKDVTLTGRLPFWQELLPIVADRLWLGYGFAAAFGGFFSPVHDAWMYNQWAGDAHNAYLQILLELGVVGLMLFIISFARALWRALPVISTAPGAAPLWPLVILTQTMISSVTESGLQSDSMGWTFYLVAVLSVAAQSRMHPTRSPSG